MPATTVSILMNRPVGHPEIPFKTKTGNELMKRRFDTVAARRLYGNSTAIAKRHLSKAMSRLVEQGIYLPMSEEMIAGEMAATGLISDLQVKDNQIANLSMTPLTDSVANLKEADDVEDMKMNKPTYEYNDRILAMMKRRVNAPKKDDRTDYGGMFNAMREQEAAKQDMNKILKKYYYASNNPKGYLIDENGDIIPENVPGAADGAGGYGGGGGHNDGGMGPGGGHNPGYPQPSAPPPSDSSSDTTMSEASSNSSFGINPNQIYPKLNLKLSSAANANKFNGVPPENNPNSGSFIPDFTYVPQQHAVLERDMNDELPPPPQQEMHAVYDLPPKKTREVAVKGKIIAAVPKPVDDSLSQHDMSIMSRDGHSVAGESSDQNVRTIQPVAVDSSNLRYTDIRTNNRVSHNFGNLNMTNNKEYNESLRREAMRQKEFIDKEFARMFNGGQIPVAEAKSADTTNPEGRVTNTRLRTQPAATPVITPDAVTNQENLVKPVKTEDPIGVNLKKLTIQKLTDSPDILASEYSENGYSTEVFERLTRRFANPKQRGDEEGDFINEFRMQDLDTPAYKAYMRYLKLSRPDWFSLHSYDAIKNRHAYLRDLQKRGKPLPRNKK